MSHCHTCKFSTWERTPTGRISNKVPGRCAYVRTVPTPTSGLAQGEPVIIRGGAIWHKDNVKCATYQRAKP